MQTSIFSQRRMKTCWRKVGEVVAGGLCFNFKRDAVAVETFIRMSTNLNKSIGGIETRELYSYPMQQPGPTRFQIQRDVK